MSLLLASVSPAFGTNDVGRHMAGGGVEPAFEHGVIAEGGRGPPHANEDGLGDIFRRVRIATHQPEGATVNEIDMRPHQRGKRRLRTIVGVAAQELGVIGYDLQPVVATQRPNRPRK